LGARAEVMPVRTIVEEHYKEDDSASFDPHALTFDCAIGKSSPWGFGFAGFETTWRKPIELEVTGSGGYTGHDMFSIVGFSLDYHTPKGWTERSIFGLGLIPPSRGSHPPGWGAGASNQKMHGDVVSAKDSPQRVTIDPAKTAPKDWDGQLWIGVMIHNVGAGKSIRVHIANATSDAPAIADRAAMLREHQQQFLNSAMKTLRVAKAKPQPIVHVVSELTPYLTSPANVPPVDQRIEECETLLAASKQAKPIPAADYLKAVENYFAFVNAVPHANDLPERLNAFHQKWIETGRFGSEMKCIIRTASNLQKVGLDDVVSGTIVSAKPQASVKLSAARHEHEGFQIVLTPMVGSVATAKLSATDLTGDAGTIAASNVTINPVGYLRIRPGELAPDPLLLGESVSLKPGENQPVWISVYVPRDAKPGTYSGAIKVQSGSTSLDVPFTLHVRSFEIPKKISLRSSFWMFRDQLNRFYHLDEVKLDDYLKWVDFALEHRLNPIDVYEGHCQQLVDIQQMPTTRQSTNAGEANPHPDFTKWDKYIDHMVAGGASTIHLGTTHHFGNFFQPSDKNEAKHLKNLELAVKTMADHYKQRGVFDLHYLQLRDETSEPASLAVYKDIYQKFPDAKLLLTAPSNEARPWLRIPCPLSPAFEAKWRDDTHKKGNEYWWYVCVQPSDRRYANLFIDQPASQHRILFWQTWSHDVDGLLYWGMNFWSWYDHQYPADVKGPTLRVQPKDAPNFVTDPNVPGDGSSMYPGPTPDRPLSSIRLEVMRDGEEDYEYFKMLDGLIKNAGDSSSPAVENAKKLREQAKSMVESLTEYDKNPEPYLALREKIGDAIEALSK
jgi:hypothetical protein